LAVGRWAWSSLDRKENTPGPETDGTYGTHGTYVFPNEKRLAAHQSG